MRTERGVMVMKNGKAWGQLYNDGQCTQYGWMDLEVAPISNPKFCKKPTDVTYKDSPYIKELETAQLVRVRRYTMVIIEEGA